MCNDLPEIRTIFTIVGDCFDINKVKELLNIEPSCYWKKGDLSRNGTFIKEDTYFEISTQAEKIYHAEESIKKIVKILFEKKEVLLKIKESMNLDYRIELVVSIIGTETPSIYINEEIIKLLSEMGISIDIDLYVSENDCSELQSIEK